MNTHEPKNKIMNKLENQTEVEDCRPSACYPKKLFAVKLPSGKYHSSSGIINGMLYEIIEEGKDLIFGRKSIGIGIGECFEPIAILPENTERYYYG